MEFSSGIIPVEFLDSCVALQFTDWGNLDSASAYIILVPH